MRLASGLLTLSPTDLSNHLTCRHRTGLTLTVAAGHLRPPEWNDRVAQALRDRGAEHERAYVESLRAQGLRVDVIDGEQAPDARGARTTESMRAGADVIVQAALANERWLGYADVLRRVPAPSALGGWSYEPYDTKLARETRGGTILQLAVYVELLEQIQGVRPERFGVVTPGRDESPFIVTFYRYADFAAYVRVVRDQLWSTLALGHDAIREAHYPEPVEACDVCRWFDRCHRQRRKDDHLSFIAGIGRVHREELVAQGFPTLTAAAAIPLPIPFTPARGSRDTYARLREQARVQHAQRTTGRPVHELLVPVEKDHGLSRLPEPSPGDLFLDLEAARFAREGGREYLFGIWTRADGYTPVWAFTDAAECAAFEATIDRVMRALAAHPGAHVYHFGHYEPSALKRLMGRHATRAEQLDELLRGERFVDLHAVVRQAVRAGVESYSIKQLEQFYGFTRAQPLGSVSACLQTIELALEANAPAAIPDEAGAAVEAYNQDDCRSTEALRDWLERLRGDLEAQGTPVPRPTPKDGEANEKVLEMEGRQEAARARLLEGLAPEASTDPQHPQHPYWLLAYLIDWHRREDKSQYWERYRLAELADNDLLEERQAIAGLEFVARVEVSKYKNGNVKSLIDRYRYPFQEVELGRGGELRVPGNIAIGSLDDHDRLARTIDIKKSRTSHDVHPSAVFQAIVFSTDTQQEALLRFANDPDAVCCGADLLFRRPPRLRSGPFVQQPDERVVDFAVRLATALDRTTLAIQGPPGAGKTYAGAQMIRALVRAGKRVGVTAVSHKVIRNLLEAVAEQEQMEAPGVSAREQGPGFSVQEQMEGPAFRPARRVDVPQARPKIRLGHKCEPSEDAEGGDAGVIKDFADNGPALDALASGAIDVLGGTSWLWSREDAAASVDVLFVDEAGQMSLANALAVSGAAGSLVLLGDPQQLEQPQKGTHPDGVGASALEHVLAGAATMPADRGLFLPTTWRLHPTICAFTSELFYEGKLQPKPGLDRQCLAGTNTFDGAGLWWVPVDHDGNQNASMEEVDVVERLANQLLAPGACWEDEKGVRHPLTPADLRIVAAYNAQVNRLTERLAARGVPVGTVDKFQGQEAPVVIYSMATSRPEDAPRGMEFLYSLNRLNVATSRARCAAIVVASPRLVEPACRTPRQMLLANALCRYRELAAEGSV